MAECTKKYASLLKRLLPEGRAWEQIKLSALWEGLAGEFCRIEQRAKDLLYREFDPLQAEELLDDWMDLVGIPDECTSIDLTEDELRRQVVQKLATLGGISAKYFEEVASFLGFEDIDVFNYVPFTVGRSRVGDPLTNDSPPRDVFRVGTHTVGQRLKTPGWVHYFGVRVPIAEFTYFRVGLSRVGEPLVDFGNRLMECTLTKIKPAESGIFFTFGG